MGSEPKTILLVEDDPLLAFTEIHWLKRAGYNSLHVLTGERAIDIVREKRNEIDLILMDINLGSGIDGTQAAGEILKVNDIPIIFLSSHTEKEVVEKTERITSYGYVVKDSNEVVLLASIKMALKLHSFDKELRIKEAALRESEHKFRNAVECSSDGIFIHVDGIIEYVNPALIKLSGFSREEIIGKPFINFVHVDDVNIVLDRHKRRARGEIVESVYEIKMMYKNGRACNADVNIAPISYDNKPAVLVTVRDITERKQVEAELRESKERYKALLQSVTDYIYSVKLENGNAVSNTHSPGCIAITGYSPEDFQNDSYLWYRMVYDEDKSYVVSENEKILKGQTVPVLEHRIVHKNGSIRWIKNSVSLLHNSDGNLKGYDGLIEDITERKLAEKELERSLSLLEATLESTADGILVVDNDGHVLRYNKKFVELWNIPEYVLNTKLDEKLIAYVLGQLKHPDLFLSRVHELYAMPHEVSLDIVELNDGRIYERYSQPQIIDDEAVGRVWSFSDITMRNRAEIEIHEREKKYRDLVEKIPDGIYKSSHEGKFLEINEAMVDMLGYESKEDLLAIEIKSQLYFQEQDRESAALQEKLEETAVFRLKKKDGSEIWVEDHGRHVLDENGNVLYHEGIMRDVTERVKAERIQNAVYEISETAYIAADIYDLYKRIHKVVSDFIKVKNYYIAIYDENSGLLSFPYFVDEHDSQPLPKKLGNGLTEYVLRTKKALLVNAQTDLELRHSREVELIGTPQAIWLGVPLIIGGKSIGVIVVQDYENENAFGQEEMHLLTFVSEQIALAIERKKNEEEIAKITDELRHSNQMKDKFFSIIAHDLKNPFYTISSVLKLLLSEEEELSVEERNKFLKGLLLTSEKAHSLLENLLLWSQNQMGKMNYDPEKIGLVEMVTSSIEFLKNNAYLKNIVLQHSVAEELYVIADRNMIETVLRNLISNAIKFTKDNGYIDIEAEVNHRYVEVSVSDNGVGIAKENISKLFRIDQTYTTQGTRSEIGTGLGLILCKEFIEKNNGTIQIESRVGKGTKISFTLPLA